MDGPSGFDGTSAVDRHATRLALEPVGDQDAEPGGESVEFDQALAKDLVDGVVAHRDEIDETIAKTSHSWRPERMDRVDRNALRIGVYELLHVRDVPAAISINEAVELTKRFGAAGSSAFVNGVLDAVAKQVATKE